MAQSTRDYLRTEFRVFLMISVGGFVVGLALGFLLMRAS